MVVFKRVFRRETERVHTKHITYCFCILHTRLSIKVLHTYYISHYNEKKNLGKDALQKYSSHSFFFVYVVVYVVGFLRWSSSNDDFEDDDDVSGKISSER